jgi:hypothetical protein
MYVYHPPELLKILSSLTIESAEASSFVWLIFRGWYNANKIAAFQQIKWKFIQNLNVWRFEIWFGRTIFVFGIKQVTY